MEQTINKTVTTGAVANIVEKVFWEAIDLGRSGIRMLGKKDNIYRVFESSFIEIDVATDTRKDCDPFDDFVIVKAPKQSIVGKRFVKGKGMQFYHGVTKKAGSTELKTNQDSNYINFAYAIATNIIKKKFSKSTEDIRAGVCIPSSEYFSANGKEMKKNLSGSYEIMFPMTGETVIFKINPEKLGIVPEGVVAFFPLTKSVNKGKVSKSIVVVVDVGHGSTDITIAINGAPSGNTSRSFNIGGITIEVKVGRLLEEAGHGASRGNVMSAIQNGWIQNGLELVDVSPLVIQAKKEFAEMIEEKVLDVLTAAGMQPNEVSYFYFVGRAFLPSLLTGDKYDTKDLRTLFLDKWSVKSVQKLDLVSPISNPDMIKELEIPISEAEELLFKDIEVIGEGGVRSKRFNIGLSKDGEKVIKRTALTTIEGFEIIPAEVANVTGVALMIK